MVTMRLAPYLLAIITVLAMVYSQPAHAVPSLDEALDTIVVCREGTYLNAKPFTTETLVEGHDAWPATAQDLDPSRFRNPEFRRIPQAEGFLLIQETSEGLSGETELKVNGVTIQAGLAWSESDKLHWRRLQARVDDEDYLGVAMNSVYWRPSQNLAGSSLPRETLDAALREGLEIRFQDSEAHDHAILDSSIFQAPFESAQALCFDISE